MRSKIQILLITTPPQLAAQVGGGEERMWFDDNLQTSLLYLYTVGVQTKKESTNVL